MSQYQGLDPVTKVHTGIEGLEHITQGGLPAGRPTLLSGSAGAGKTILALQLLYLGATKLDRPGVFVTLEEPAREIVRNVKGFGWDLPALDDAGRLRIVDASPSLLPEEEAGPFDLGALLARIEYAIEAIGARFLVIDSLGSLFQRYNNANLVRREVYRIVESVRAMDVTALLTAERRNEYGAISEYGVEEFVADNAIILRNVLKEEKVRRTIQVLKMRGDSHFKGEFPFTISKDGISILPLAARQLKQSSSNNRVSIGNEELDAMAGGGLFRDSVFLISGPTGGGKTLMANTFAAEGCSKGERVLMLAYEESRAQLLRNAQSWGMDFADWEERGLLRLVCQYPESLGLEDHLLTIQREIESFRPSRLVMDSVSAMERVGPVTFFREFVIGLTSYAKEQEICSLFTATTPKLAGGDSITEAHISTITDAIILLRYVETNGKMRRGIAIIKMRGSQHDKDIHEFTIGSDGMHILGAFENVQNIILGIPSTIPPSEREQLEDMFQH